jgi:hypothetical protein
MNTAASLRITLLCGMLLLSVVTDGCRPDEISPTPAVLESITITPGDGGMAPGTTLQFRAAGNFSSGSRPDLTALASWSSSDAAVATISDEPGSKGLVSAVGAGTTTITATREGVTASTSLTVSPVATIAVIPQAPPSIAPGTTLQFTAAGILQSSQAQDLTTFATWTSSNAAVAAVSDAPDSKGLATAATVTGAATISAEYTGVTGTATLTTSAVASIAVAPASASIANGTTRQFTATGTLQDFNTQNLTTFATWTASNPAVAFISNASGTKGQATAVGEGFTSVSAIFSSIASTAQLTVTPAVLTSLAVTPENPSVPLGATQQFTAIGTFTDNSEQDVTESVTWSAGNQAVAGVSNTAGTKGLATAQAIGSTTIRAASGNVSGQTVLTVTPVQLVSIDVAPALAAIVVNTPLQFTATGRFSDSSTQDLTASVTWSSSNPAVATISNQAGIKGLATGLTTGTVTIQATFSGITSNAATLTVTP